MSKDIKSGLSVENMINDLVAKANKAKDEIMTAIKDIEDKMRTNQEFIEKAEKCAKEFIVWHCHYCLPLQLFPHQYLLLLKKITAPN